MDLSLSDVLWVGGGLLAVMIVSLLFTRRDEIAQAARSIMPSRPTSAPIARDMDLVSIPVRHTSMDAHTTGDDHEMPRIGRALSDPDIVILLAAQKRAGKFRFSANQIHTLVGGDRNIVLRQVREIREGLPKAEFRTDPERDEWRAEVGLPQR